MDFAIAGYRLRQGSGLDRASLVHFLGKTYAEVSGTQDVQNLSRTVEQHLSPETPLWWVETEADSVARVACLWLGNAIDPQRGDRYGYVLMLYVDPAHRRRGIATALLTVAQGWAIARGDRQIGLQVLPTNSTALALYQKLGYHTQSLWMTKAL